MTTVLRVRRFLRIFCSWHLIALGLQRACLILRWDFIRWLLLLDVLNGATRFLSWIFSGVLQGCPLAGSFFAIAMDPFLRCFDRLIDACGEGIVRACADDIGASLRDIGDLSTMKDIFDLAQALAGLSLKPSKVHIVPAARKSSACELAFVKQWLATNVAEWADFKVAHTAKYLGAYLGPEGGSMIWQAAIAKWAARSYAIASARAPLKPTVHLYNTRAVTTLSYISRGCSKRARDTVKTSAHPTRFVYQSFVLQFIRLGILVHYFFSGDGDSHHDAGIQADLHHVAIRCEFASRSC